MGPKSLLYQQNLSLKEKISPKNLKKKKLWLFSQKYLPKTSGRPPLWLFFFLTQRTTEGLTLGGIFARGRKGFIDLLEGGLDVAVGGCSGRGVMFFFGVKVGWCWGGLFVLLGVMLGLFLFVLLGWFCWFWGDFPKTEPLEQWSYLIPKKNYPQTGAPFSPSHPLQSIWRLINLSIGLRNNFGFLLLLGAFGICLYAGCEEKTKIPKGILSPGNVLEDLQSNQKIVEKFGNTFENPLKTLLPKKQRLSHQQKTRTRSTHDHSTCHAPKKVLKRMVPIATETDKIVHYWRESLKEE